MHKVTALWLLGCCLLLPAAVRAQAAPQVKVQVQIKPSIRALYTYNAAQWAEHEIRLSEHLVREVNDGYWGEFCWELSATTPAATAKLEVTLDSVNNNWELSVFFITEQPVRIRKRLERKTVLDSASVIAVGRPNWPQVPGLLKGWFCDEVLEVHRKKLHQSLCDNVSVGHAEVASPSIYAVYLPSGRNHFDRSLFRIIGGSTEMEVRALAGSAQDANYNTWNCIRLIVSPRAMSGAPLPGNKGTAYLVKYVPPGGDGGEDLTELVLEVDH